MIAQAHIVSMECINQIEIAPHEPVTPVHFREASLSNAGPAIKIAARGKTVSLQRLRRHAEGLKRNAIVTVTFVQPPVVVKQTALTMQSLVERRGRKWGEMIECRNVEGLFSSKCHRLGKAGFGVAIVAENKSAIDPHTMLAQICQRFLEAAAHRVKGFIHVPEVYWIQALKPNEHTLATAADQQVQKLFVVSRVDAGLADPTDLQGNQRTEKLFSLLEI